MTSISDVSITSDKDYLKIFDDGQIFISATAAAAADETFPIDAYAATLSGSVTLTHSLGTPPLVRAFWDPQKNGTWWSTHAFPNGTEVDPFLSTLIDSTTVRLIIGTNGAATTNVPVFYRIYDLGAYAVTSDSRIDKIFKKETSSASVGGAGSSFSPTFVILTIPHGQSTPPIWTLQFSEDGTNWYGEDGKIVGPPDTATGPPGGPYAVYYYTRAFAKVDSTNFYIYLENNYPGSKTIYYRYALDYRA